MESKNQIPKILNRWKIEILTHKKLILVSAIFLVIASFLNYCAGIYAERTVSVAVPDLILDHIQTTDLDFIFIYGFIAIVVVFFLYPLIRNVKELHIAISQFSLLILIRSFFVSVTHLKTPVDAFAFNIPKYVSFFFFQNDQFFSGHTAIPFLGFLLFRKEKIGIFFLIATIVMMATVLFMHVHYSIDVFAALFITYSSYKIGQLFFRKINHY